MRRERRSSHLVGLVMRRGAREQARAWKRAAAAWEAYASGRGTWAEATHEQAQAQALELVAKKSPPPPKPSDAQPMADKSILSDELASMLLSALPALPRTFILERIFVQQPQPGAFVSAWQADDDPSGPKSTESAAVSSPLVYGHGGKAGPFCSECGSSGPLTPGCANCEAWAAAVVRAVRVSEGLLAERVEQAPVLVGSLIPAAELLPKTAESSEHSESTEENELYEVQRGDSWNSIAKKVGCDVRELVKFNGRNWRENDELAPGGRLRRAGASLGWPRTVKIPPGKCRAKPGPLEEESPRCFWRLYSPGPRYVPGDETTIEAGSGALCRACAAEVGRVLKGPPTSTQARRERTGAPSQCRGAGPWCEEHASPFAEPAAMVCEWALRAMMRPAGARSASASRGAK